MSRKNIFDILNEKNDISCQINKIEKLLLEASVDGDKPEMIVDMYCMCNWKARGRYTCCKEMRERLGITQSHIREELDQKHILLYLEFVANIIWLLNNRYIESEYEYENEYVYLQENTLGLIGDLGYDAKIFEEEEKVLLIEKNAAMTAVAEIVEPELAYDVIEYNHYLLKGNIAEKQKILKVLADKFESMRNDLRNVNSTLESNTGYLLNKMNIRHNNKEGKNAIPYVQNLSDEELEMWYDETYQMLLLCILEYDNIERNRRVAELKQKMEVKQEEI